MTTLIILIVLVAIGSYLLTKYRYALLGSIMCGLFGVWTVIHGIAWGIAPYEYGLFIEKRNAFEQTLKVARENGNKYETAAIVKDVSEWNQKLAEYKYNNKIIFLGQYVDDRVELLNPIK